MEVFGGILAGLEQEKYHWKLEVSRSRKNECGGDSAGVLMPHKNSRELTIHDIFG